MYTYCDNNPVNCSDPSGESAIAAGIGIACVTILALLTVASIASSSSNSVGTAIYNATQSVVEQTKQNIQNKLTAVGAAGALLYSSIAGSNSNTKAKEKEYSSRRSKDLPQYRSASLVSNTVVIGQPLKVEEASLRVAQGGDILCVNQKAAQHILFLNGYHNAVGPEIGRGEGFYWHYHPTRNNTGKKNNVHIWYLQ